MKFCVIVPDGCADDPLEELDGRTPVEAAETPNLDRLAREGRVGQVTLIPKGLPSGSDVANMAVLGYDPMKYYTGRAPLEAASAGIRLGSRDWAVRANLVTVVDGVMEDYSGGHISTKEATLIIDLLNERLGGENVSFHAGVSYRNLLILRDRDGLDVKTTPPHDIIGEETEGYLPKGKDARLLRDLMAASAGILATHEINQVRLELGENPATMVWLWGEGQSPEMPSFIEKYGKRAAVISAVDLLRGLAISMRMDVIAVPGATGYYDTDYAAKGRYACQALGQYDLVFVHVEAPDEAGHNGDIDEKVKAIEQIDRHIIGPVLDCMAKRGEPWRVMVLPDHATPVKVRTHTAVPVPFAMMGEGVVSSRGVTFSERNADESDLKVRAGHELMEYFLGLPD